MQSDIVIVVVLERIFHIAESFLIRDAAFSRNLMFVLVVLNKRRIRGQFGLIAVIYLSSFVLFLRSVWTLVDVVIYRGLS